MCNDLNVNLPTLVSFLLLYPLKCGCIVTLLWTLVRSLFVFVFLLLAMVDTFLPGSLPILTKKPPVNEHYFFVITSHLVMIVTETILFTFCIYLGLGLYSRNPFRISKYLICRFFTWISETTFLSILCLTHLHLIGWYLAFLMIVILEFYCFIVVYSYYMELMDECNEKQLEALRKVKDVSINTNECGPVPISKGMLCTTL